jgi:hypothetical protein
MSTTRHDRAGQVAGAGMISPTVSKQPSSSRRGIEQNQAIRLAWVSIHQTECKVAIEGKNRYCCYNCLVTEWL